MAGLLDRAGMTISSTGTTTPLTLGSALGAVAPNLASFMDLVTAGAVDQETYRYFILDSNGAYELGKGVFSLAGLTMTRNVKFSTNSNNPINLTASAQIFIGPDKDDILSMTEDQTSIYTQTEKAQMRVNHAGAPIEAMASNVLNLNGGMEVSQLNGSSAVTLTATSSLQTTYIVDGVQAGYRGTFVATAQQVTDAPVGFKNSVKLTIGTAEASIGANDELGVVLPIEGVRCAKLGFGAASANAIAVFFWTKANRTGTYSASLRNGAKTRSYPFNFSVINSNTWEYKSIIIQGDQSGTWALDTTVGLYLNIAIAAGSSRVGGANAWAGSDYSGVTSTTNGVAATTDVFQVTGVGSLPLVAGVTVGDIPDSAHSPFLVPHFDRALIDARRQWQKSYDYATAPGAANHNGMVYGGFTISGFVCAAAISLGQQMRAVPTIAFFDGAGNASKVSAAGTANPSLTFTDNLASVLSPTDISPMGFLISGYAGSNNVSTFLHYTADARL